MAARKTTNIGPSRKYGDPHKVQPKPVSSGPQKATVCLCCGGTRKYGPHPTHPDDYPKDFWPMPLPHEMADWKQRTHSKAETVEQRETPVVTDAKTKAYAPVKKTTTGLITLEDFIGEAETLGVMSDELRGKLVNAFASDAPNEGMRRMRCNNLINNAVKRRDKC